MMPVGFPNLRNKASALGAFQRLSVKFGCISFGEHTTPSQMTIPDFKDIPPAFALFEMNAMVFRLNPLANGRQLGGLPNIRSSPADRDTILSRQNFFHILGT